MRIIDEINRGELKITVFKMNDRLSVKFERELSEIIYKFRDGSGFDEKSYRSFLSESLLMKVEALLYNANILKNETLGALQSPDDDLPMIL